LRALVVRLMTSRELTSGFDFWSCVISAWSWCIFSSNLKQIHLFNPELLTFSPYSRWRPPPSWIFRLCSFDYSCVYIVWYLCSVPNLVQISTPANEINALMLQMFIDDVTRINFRFRHLVTWSSPHDHDSSSHQSRSIYFIQAGVIDIFPKFKMVAAAILDF